MNKYLNIRPLAAEDYAAVGRIFPIAIHEGTRGAYDYRQRLAWGGETLDLDSWKNRLENLTGFVAEIDGEPVGFIAIDQTGYVDLAYVLPSAGRRGVGRRLLDRAEQWAKNNGATRLTTAASLVAHPFFLKNCWHAIEEEHVDRRGVILRRFKMQKDLT